MTKLALTLPWGAETATLANPAENNFAAKGFEIGTVISKFTEVALYAGAFLMFFWMAWGVFDYIKAEGNKEALTKARKRIQWAIAGFIILLMSFFISNFLKEMIYDPFVQQQPLQTITPP